MIKLSIRTGKVNLKKQSASVSAFSVSRTPSVGIQFLNVAARNPNNSSIEEVGSPTFVPSVPGVKPDICGRFVDSSYSLEEGALVRVKVNVRRGYGHMEKSGYFHIRVRDNAAFRHLTIPLLEEAMVAYTSAFLKGKFDILDVEELENELSSEAPIGEHIRRLSGSNIFESLNIVSDVLVPEKLSADKKIVKEVVDLDTGEKRKVVTRIRKRRGINL